MIATHLHDSNRVIPAALVPLLKHLNAGTLSMLMMVALAFTGRLPMAQAGNRNPLNHGLATQKPDYRDKLFQDYLIVYSATDRFDDGDLSYYVPSSYSIYTIDGRVFKRVDNHISPGDEIPELVSLPAGSYSVEARSADNGYVRVYVVIKPGQRTVLDLHQRG
jgi:hypothetical protein